MIIVGTTVRLTGRITQDRAPCDLTGATVAIRVQKPDGSRSDWPPTILDPTTGEFQLTMSPASNNQDGGWTYWAVGTLADTTEIKSAARSYQVYPEGSE